MPTLAYCCPSVRDKTCLLTSHLFSSVFAHSVQTMDESPPPPFVVGSNYHPLDVIGEGAYGVVWLVCLLSPFRDRRFIILPFQLCNSRSNTAEGRYQANHTLRSLYVLSPDPPRNKTSPSLSPREHHRNLGHSTPSKPLTVF